MEGIKMNKLVIYPYRREIGQKEAPKELEYARAHFAGIAATLGQPFDAKKITVDDVIGFFYDITTVIEKTESGRRLYNGQFTISGDRNRPLDDILGSLQEHVAHQKGKITSFIISRYPLPSIGLSRFDPIIRREKLGDGEYQKIAEVVTRAAGAQKVSMVERYELEEPELN